MKEKIIERLHEIEKKYDVKVLLAVESGSKAWGFASKDSDYDVRFVYVHRKNWYLSLVEGRDVIEEMDPDGILDFAGWDLRKALLLMSKCNSMFVEWLRSPVVYYKDCTFVYAVEKLSRLCFRRNYCMNHYYHMAVKHDERYLEKRGFELKRFMYYLRGLLAAKWAFVENDYPPVPFMTLVDALVTDKAVHDELVEMVRLKSESKEHDTTIVSDKLIEYAASLQAEIESALKDQKKESAPDIKPLNDFFLEYIDQMDENFDRVSKSAMTIVATSNKQELLPKSESFTDIESMHVAQSHFEPKLYVEESKTVTFHEVLHQTNIENVIIVLKAHYKSSENDLDGYRKLMNELLGKKPVSSKYQISIEHVITDDEEYENVSGVIPGDEQAYGIEFNSREEWLGMHLTEDTLKNYSNEDIIAHCLWEMTFFGFTDSEVQKKKDDLIDSCLSEDGGCYTIEDRKLIPEDFLEGYGYEI